MAWKLKFKNSALKQLKKLDKSAQIRILDYLESRIASDEDPKRFGKPLTRDMKGFWRYRVDDYRIICRIVEDQLVVSVVKVGPRRDIYD